MLRDGMNRGVSPDVAISSALCIHAQRWVHIRTRVSGIGGWGWRDLHLSSAATIVVVILDPRLKLGAETRLDRHGQERERGGFSWRGLMVI